jgi:hypothetical protein
LVTILLWDIARVLDEVAGPAEAYFSHHRSNFPGEEFRAVMREVRIDRPLKM